MHEVSALPWLGGTSCGALRAAPLDAPEAGAASVQAVCGNAMYTAGGWGGICLWNSGRGINNAWIRRATPYMESRRGLYGRRAVCGWSLWQVARVSSVSLPCSVLPRGLVSLAALL